MSEFTIVLASKSPRRQELIKELGFPFEIRIKDVDENYPGTITPYDVPEFLAKLKSEPLISTLTENEILLTSDTVVIHNDTILGKPKDRLQAFHMLSSLSNSSHDVVTGVSLISKNKKISFATKTKVYFSPLTETEINFYIDTYKPFDKAGSYGIQEWIGYIAVQKIEGCYYNVMGLPIHDVYRSLIRNFMVE